MVKCYDMIPRKLAYEVLRRLGIPRRVLEGWVSYLENLQFYNTIGAAAEKVHEITRSLPQGDSWSTRALAGLLVIWAGRLREMNATPRLLADDMLGGDHGDPALHQEHGRAGSQIQAPRGTLGPWAEPIPVSVDIRDFGCHSHFSCRKRTSAKTLKARIDAAVPIAKRVGKMRLTTRRRVRVLRAKVFAKALYVKASVF